MTKSTPNYPPFNPFLRHPTPPLAKLRMALLGPILVPLRLAGAILTLSSCLLWCQFCLFGVDKRKPYSVWRRILMQRGVAAFSRILLFFYGFVRLHVTRDNKTQQKEVPPSVVVVNHIGFAELMYLVYSDGCCFVSKEENRKLPFIGTISEALQSIFVDRGDGDKRKRKSIESSGSSVSSSSAGTRSTTEQILERAHAKPGTYPPLCICPEGTTHTGHVLIKFATGAFRAGLPVQPVVVKSPFSPVYGYDPSFSCANIVLHVLCLMTQPMNQLHVKHLPVYIPNEKEKKDPSLYANNVRKVMAKELGVDCYDLTWADKLRFETSARARELGNELLAEKNGGVVPPMPVFVVDAFGNALVSEEREESAKKKD